MEVSEIIKLNNLKLGKVQHSQLPENVSLACTSDANKNPLTKNIDIQQDANKNQTIPNPKVNGTNQVFLLKAF